MNTRLRNILTLALIYVVLFVIGNLIIRLALIEIEIGLFLILLTSMTIITLGTYLLVGVGLKRKESDRGTFLFAGIGGKFLAYLIMILIFWKSKKNFETEFIITFFVLYLALTIYLIAVLYKELKIN